MTKIDINRVANIIRKLNLKEIAKTGITLSEDLQEELRKNIAEQFAVLAFSGSEREAFIQDCVVPPNKNPW